ncbi:hypothetical protein DM02DRAFT_666947 [Periconia macrospinosa]|uniref:Uncharacterized protein n=1 Tax=Periconia macrospinosa TaxID=97972 RepID=A0A2V1ED74_9PLEO|nr:hypothetical protein DM02DRAFT_666947 [Periconia macrospinosa]
MPQRKEKSSHRTHSLKKDPKNAQSQPSPKTPSTLQSHYMFDTAASKNRYRDKVPLTPSIAAQLSPSLEFKSSLVRRVSSIKQDARRPTSLRINTGVWDSADLDSPLRSARSIRDQPPQKETGGDDASKNAKILELEQRLAQAVAEKGELETKLQQREHEGVYLSEKELQNLSINTREIYERNEALEETLHQYLSDIGMWRAKWEQAQQQLEEQEERQRQQRRERSSALSPIKREGEEVHMIPINEDLSAAYDDLRLDYEDTRVIVQKLRAENKDLHDGVPRMRRENQILKKQLAFYQTHCETIQKSLDNATAESAEWKAEYKLTLDKLEKQRFEFDTLLEQKDVEMNRCIREYRDGMSEQNGEWWDIQSLQKKLRKMEQDNYEISQRLEAVKKDKEAAYQESSKLNKELGEMKKSRSDYNHPSRKLAHKSWDTAEAAAARKQTMTKLRKEKRMERERDNREEEILEQVRRWYMEKSYPPGKRSYTKLPRKSWHRWHGDEWLDRGATHVDTRDKEVIDRLRR